MNYVARQSVHSYCTHISQISNLLSTSSSIEVALDICCVDQNTTKLLSSFQVKQTVSNEKWSINRGHTFKIAHTFVLPTIHNLMQDSRATTKQKSHVSYVSLQKHTQISVSLFFRVVFFLLFERTLRLFRKLLLVFTELLTSLRVLCPTM